MKMPYIPTSFVAIDFETLYSQRVSACSVGMVKYVDGKIVDRYYTLIRPPFDYPGKTHEVLTWVHGIREEDVVNERTFTEILPEMESFAEGLPLAAHYASVERACIHDATAFYGLTTTLDYENIIDTCKIAPLIEASLGIDEKGRGTHMLDAVCRRFHLPELEHHHALADAEMCGNLLVEFATIAARPDFKIKEKPKPQPKKYEKYRCEDMVQRVDLECVPDNPFKDCAVVLTGFPILVSQEYGHLLKELGAKVCSGVTKKTSWLICGANAGPSKMAKAEELGAQIINENEFLEIINKY